MLPDHADDVTELMQRADIAMYAAKRLTRRCALLYDPTSDGHSTERLMLLGDLRKALGTTSWSFTTSRRSTCDRSRRRPRGAAALAPPDARQHPAERLHPARRAHRPDPRLTRYVLELVCARWPSGTRERLRGMPVAVNLSARNLIEPSFAEYVADLLASHHVDPCLLELEVTESAMIEDPVRSHEMLHKLAALGVKIAVDDFGTGYTSMAQLEAMPLRR